MVYLYIFVLFFHNSFLFYIYIYFILYLYLFLLISFTPMTVIVATNRHRLRAIGPVLVIMFAIKFSHNFQHGVVFMAILLELVTRLESKKPDVAIVMISSQFADGSTIINHEFKTTIILVMHFAERSVTFEKRLDFF